MNTGNDPKAALDAAAMEVYNVALNEVEKAVSMEQLNQLANMIEWEENNGGSFADRRADALRLAGLAMLYVAQLK